MVEPAISEEEEHRNDGNCQPSESANSKRTAAVAVAVADTDSASTPLWKGVKPGAKIAVYDPKTKHYYPCTVLREVMIETETGPCGLFEVQYEDSTEIANLATTRFRWQDCEEGEEEEGNDDDEDYAEEEDDDDDDDDVCDDDDDNDNDDDDESWDGCDDDRKPAARRSSKRAAKRNRNRNRNTKRNTKRVIEIVETDDEDNGDEADDCKDASNTSNATNQRRRATRRNSVRIAKHEVNPIIEIDSSDDEHNKGSETKSARDDEDNEDAASHRVPVHDGTKDDAARERCEPAGQDRSKGSEPGIDKNAAAGKEADAKSKKRKEVPSNSEEKKEPATAANSDEESVASVASVASVQARYSSETAEEADAKSKKRKEAPTQSPSTELQSKSNSSEDGVVLTKNEDDREQVAMSPQKKMKFEATSVASIEPEPKIEPKSKTEPKTTPKSKCSSKPRTKRGPSKRMTEYRARKAEANQSSEKEAAETNKPKRLTVKDVKASHDAKESTKEDALLSLLVAHSIAGIQGVTFERLFTELGYRPKNRAVEKAWKEVRQDGLVEEARAPPEGRKTKGRLYRLTQKGIDRAAPKEYLQWVAEASAQENAAASNAELHELIKGNAVNDYGAVIFEIMLEANQKGVAKSPTEMADECGVDKDSHGFFYGFKWLKDQGYAIADPRVSKARSKMYVLSEKCFV